MTDSSENAPAKTAGITAKIEEALCSEVKHQQYMVAKSNQEMADGLMDKLRPHIEQYLKETVGGGE